MTVALVAPMQWPPVYALFTEQGGASPTMRHKGGPTNGHKAPDLSLSASLHSPIQTVAAVQPDRCSARCSPVSRHIEGDDRCTCPSDMFEALPWFSRSAFVISAMIKERAGEMCEPETTSITKSHIPLLASVKRATALLAPEVERIGTYKWSGADEDQFWEFYKRSIVKRQFEALSTIIHLVENKQGHFGVTFLRPAYEEMLWGTYLEQNKELAPRIAFLLSRQEIDATIDAQNQFLGAKTMQLHGFTQKRVKQLRAAFRPSMTELRVIGKTLGWRNDEPPGAAALARWTGHEKEYKFIYHATSRYVHFSTHELGRRVWGHRGSVTIGSSQFSNYWSDFALYWGFRIYIYVSSVFSDLLLDESNAKFEGMLEEIEHMYPVPICCPRPRPPQAPSRRDRSGRAPGHWPPLPRAARRPPP